MNRKYSLKKNEDIAKLVHLKQSVGNKYYAIYFQITENELPQIALSISKKFGNAVNRNYEKRVTREIIRSKINNICFLKMLIVIKKEVINLKFEEKQEQLSYLLRKLNKNVGVYKK